MTKVFRVAPLILAVSPLLAAASGRVSDPAGHPIKDAEVCAIVKGVSRNCRPVDPLGLYHISEPGSAKLFVRASGFQPLTVEAVEQSAPVVLQPAAVLRVKIVDAVTGSPIPKGKVILNYTTGQQIGASAPFNAGGVRFTTLGPGDVLIRAEAEGYDAGGPEVVTAIAGKESAVAISMKKRKAPAQ